MRINRIVAAIGGLALASGGVLASTVGTASAWAASVAGAGHAVARTGPTGGPVPRGFRVASVTFVSANDGWVLGTTKTCAHAPCTSVLRTTNGGRSWVGIPAPKYKLARSGMSAGLLRLRFANAVDGYAYGSQLWVTHNGGSSWHRVRQVPGYITDLEASAGAVYAASTRSGKQAIYSSPAGSDSWKPVKGLPKAAGAGGLGEITLHGKAGWVILGRRLYATQNGSRWTKEPFRCRRGYGIASVGAYSAKQITLLCVGNPGAGSTTKLLFASSDGGAHFTRVGSPPRGGDGGLLAEPTPGHVFVASASGATFIYVSTDGGRHWRTAKRLGDGGLGWNDFGFTTPTQGVAVEGTSAFGTTHLWLTRNAGRTWQTVKF